MKVKMMILAVAFQVYIFFSNFFIRNTLLLITAVINEFSCKKGVVRLECVSSISKKTPELSASLIPCRLTEQS